MAFTSFNRKAAHRLGVQHCAFSRWADIRLEVTGKVSRVDDDGMAIEFTGVPLDDLEHLRNLIRFNAEDPNAVEDEFDSHIGLKPRDPE